MSVWGHVVGIDLHADREPGADWNQLHLPLWLDCVGVELFADVDGRGNGELFLSERGDAVRFDMHGR